MNNFLDWLIDILRHKRNVSDISGFWYSLTDMLYYIRFLRYRSKAWRGMDAALNFDDWRKTRSCPEPIADGEIGDMMTILARQLRLAVVTNVFKQGLLDEEDARELLARSLSPGDDSAVYDDSALLGDPGGLERIAGRPLSL